MKTIFSVLFFLKSFACYAAVSLSQMSLEDKVGQLLMVHFRGEIANDDARILIQDIHVGGIIFYNWSNGLDTPQQVKSLSEGLQSLAQNSKLAIPLLIAADHEGGKVTRVKGLTEVLGNQTLGMSSDPFLAESSAFAIGKELMAVGINMNLAPVADVNNNPRNQIIGSRSFGDSPELVTIFAESALKGYHRAGIIACLKHFPGHGDVDIDSHEALPVIKKTRAELEAVELYPFMHLASQAPAIMTAHLLVPTLDTTCCSTLSKQTLDLLRNEAHFEGVIISDSLIMKGVLKDGTSVDDVAIRALNAGCDILLLGGALLIGTDQAKELTVADIKRIHRSIVGAVRSGSLLEGRVDEAVGRVLRLKKRYGLHTYSNF